METNNHGAKFSVKVFNPLSQENETRYFIRTNGGYVDLIDGFFIRGNLPAGTDYSSIREISLKVD